MDPARGFVGDYYGDLDESPVGRREDAKPGLLRSVADPSGAEEEADSLPLRWIVLAILIGSIGLYLSWGLQGPTVPAVVSDGARAEFDPSRAARPEPSAKTSKESRGVLLDSPETWKREDDQPTTAGAKDRASGQDQAQSGSDGTTGNGAAEVQADIDALRARKLLIPVRGVEISDLRDSYSDPRSGGREHLALDIMAPRNRKILAVEDGRIERLFQSDLGGITIYQRSADGRFIYYYAHLERYARGLEEGKEVERGDVLGFVGSTGNAPDNAPHLHFAIYRGSRLNQWWKGEPVNPYPVLARP